MLVTIWLLWFGTIFESIADMRDCSDVDRDCSDVNSFTDGIWMSRLQGVAIIELEDRWCFGHQSHPCISLTGLLLSILAWFKYCVVQRWYIGQTLCQLNDIEPIVLFVIYSTPANSPHPTSNQIVIVHVMQPIWFKLPRQYVHQVNVLPPIELYFVSYLCVGLAWYAEICAYD